MPLDFVYPPIVLPPHLAKPRAADDRGQDAAPVDAASPQDEPRPDDCAARMDRPPFYHRVRMRHRSRMIAGIIAIGLVPVFVPVLLALIGWGDPQGIASAAAQDRPAAARAISQPVALTAAVGAAWDRAFDPGAHSDAAEPTLQPSARPLTVSSLGLDRLRAQQCLTAAIYYEAAREPDAGQQAVAQVVLNRVMHPAFPKTVCGVVYQGSERAGCQFSFACDGSMARAPAAQWWERARRVAQAALAGYVFAPIGLATHYHTSAVHPGWSDSMAFLGTIGAHRFYRWSGAAGMPQAFTVRYAGGEPLPAPHPRTWVSTGADLADALVLQRAFEAGRLAALRNPLPAVAPLPATDPAIIRAGAAFGQMPLAHSVAAPAAAPAADAGAQNSASSASAVRPDAQAQFDGAARWIHQPGT